MDPVNFAEAVTPVLVIVALALGPVSLVFINKYFKLRTRELELEAQYHAHEQEARLRALEMRQAAVESALGSLSGARRSDLLEPPPADALSGVPLRIRES
jgi:cytosine/uracil/thiamine/allantoin permease